MGVVRWKQGEQGAERACWPGAAEVGRGGQWESGAPPPPRKINNFKKCITNERETA